MNRRLMFDDTQQWLIARHGLETGSKSAEEAALERLYDFDPTQDMKADERGHLMEQEYAKLHPELYHSDAELYMSETEEYVGISPDFLDDENNPKIGYELKAYQMSHHKDMYNKWKNKVDIFKPATNKGMNTEQRKYYHQLCHYFRVFTNLEELHFVMFSPFAKEVEMREFHFVFHRDILNYNEKGSCYCSYELPKKINKSAIKAVNNKGE